MELLSTSAWALRQSGGKGCSENVGNVVAELRGEEKRTVTRRQPSGEWGKVVGKGKG